MKKIMYLIPLVMFLALISSTYAETALTGWSGYSNWAGVTANSNYGIIFTSDGGGMNQSIINVTTNHAGSTFTQYRVWVNGNTGYIPQRPCGSTVENGVYRTCIFDIPANFTTEVVNMSITLTHTASWTFAYWSPTFPYNDVGPFNIITSWNNGNNGPRYDEAYPFYSIGYENMTAEIPPTVNFTITAYNSTTTSQLLSYTASINGSTYNSDGGGLINTTLATSNGGIYTLDIDAFGFYNYTEDVNISSNWRANLTQFSLTYLNSSPENDTQYNYTSIEFSVEVEYNGTPISTNCNLILNDASAGSESSGVTNGTFSPGFPATASDGINYYYWSCINDYFNLTTAPRTFYVDTTFPTITTNFVNNSIYYLSNITASINFTDDQTIFMYNVSIDGVVKGLRYNNGTSNNDTYNLNENPQWLGIGQHLLSVITADGHTKNYIEPFDKVSNGIFKDVINFQDDNKNIKIQAKDKSLSDKWTSEKQTDRYTFSYEPSKKSSDKSFIVSCDEPLYILSNPNTEYKEWVICGNKWIDFKVKGENPQISIKRNSNKEAEVSLKGLKDTSKIEFQSIGELNQKSATYTFYIFNVTTSAAPTAYVASRQYFNLSIYQGDAAFTTSAIFKYNNTLQTSSNIGDNYSSNLIIPIGTLSTDWNWTFSVGSFNWSVNGSQVVIDDINLELCNSSSANISMNYSIIDDSTYTIISSGSAAGTYVVYDADISVNKTFNFTLGLNVSSPMYICSDSNRSELKAKSNVIYTALGYYTASLETLEQSVKQVKEIIPLYLASSTAQVVVSLIGSFSSPIPNYLIKYYKYLPLTDSYLLMQSEYTDYAGNVLLHYVTTAKYRIKIYNTLGNEVYDTGKFSFVSNPTVIQLVTTDDILESIGTIGGMNSSVKCYETTRTCTFTWNNPTIGTAYLDITRRNAWGVYPVFSNSTVATSGSLSYTVVENMTSNTYHAVGSIMTNTDNKTYVLGEDDLTGGISNIDKMGDVSTTIVAAFFIILVLALLLIDFGPIGITIGICVGLLAGVAIGLIPIAISAVLIVVAIMIISLLYSRGV